MNQPICPQCKKERKTTHKYCSQKCYFDARRERELKMKKLIDEQEAHYDNQVKMEQATIIKPACTSSSIWSGLWAMVSTCFQMALFSALFVIMTIVGILIHPLLFVITVGIFGGYYLYKLFSEF